MSYRLKPMLDTASRIHSANGGVRASQARDVEAGGFRGVAYVSDAILVAKHCEHEKRETDRIRLWCQSIESPAKKSKQVSEDFSRRL